MPHSPCVDLDAEAQRQLLKIARGSIRHGLHNGQPGYVDTADLAPNLSDDAAVFVTLKKNGELRGCIGTLEAVEPLAVAVARLAFNAAFRDRRFAVLESAELDELLIEISVLSPMTAIEADNRESLMQMLRPGVDGLMLEDRAHRSTFLPQVWTQLTTPEAFLDALLQKAGLPVHYWSSTIRFSRYQSFSFAET